MALSVEGAPFEDYELLALASSSTHKRTLELHSLKEKIQTEGLHSPRTPRTPERRSLIYSLATEITLEQLPFHLRLLFTTHPYYADRPSRKAVRACLHSLYESATFRQPTLRRIINAVKVESTKPGISSANAFVLLEWTGDIFPQISKTVDDFNTYSGDLLISQVNLLDICLGSLYGKQSMKDQALVVTRRALRHALKVENYEQIIKSIVERLTAKGPTPTAKNALLLGVISGVCSRQEKLKKVLEGLKKDLYTFYVREIIGSRTLVSPVIANALHDFFSAFTTVEEFTKEVAQPLEKALLRSPEVVLNDVVSPLVKSLSTDIDLSEPLKDQLLKQLLSCLKSTNMVIRSGAVSAFTQSITRCHDEAAVEKIVEEILTPLKGGKITVVDHRILYAQMLSAVPPSESLAKKIPSGLAVVAAKEPNEAAINSLATAITNHLAAGLSFGVDPEKAVGEAIRKGITDKRPAVKRLWVLKIGDIMWGINSPSTTASSNVTQDFYTSLLPSLINVWNDITANPLPSAQSGLITAGYVFTALFLTKFSKWEVQDSLKKADIIEQCLSTQPKVSFLLNHKVYSKLTSEEDFLWIIRALAATAKYVHYDGPYVDDWAFAFLHAICAHNTTHLSRKAATHALKVVYLQRPEVIGKVILNGIWQWLRRLEMDSSTGGAKTGGKYLHLAINAISCAVPNQGDIVKRQLVNLAVVTHHQLMALGPNGGWIALCQQSQVDPGELVRENSASFIQEIKFYTALSGRSKHIRNAALNSCATLAFVARDVFTPLLVTMFQTDLNTDGLKGIGENEVKIWKAPEGELVFDPLSVNKGQAPVLKSNTKDYDTLKWEAELRAQLEKKKGQPQKKLTADEQGKLNEQLAKESAIRVRVEEISMKLRRGVGIIKALAEGSLTGVEIWMTPALLSLLNVLVAGGSMIVGQEGVAAYLRCSEHISYRLGSLRKFVGVAVLRASCVGGIPVELQEEPLTALTTRLLYRLRLAAEQRPFDITSLAFILTLVLLVLRNGGLGSSNSEETDEQIVLALEFLTYHTETSMCQQIFRGRADTSFRCG